MVVENEKIVHTFDEAKDVPRQSSGQAKMALKTSLIKGPIILFLILAVLGVGTGYVIAQTLGPTLAPLGGGGGGSITSGGKKGEIYGSRDEKTFKDNAEGILREGGIDGEGAYHLERPGGESQNVYLTSSVIDLSKFIGKKVKVWGETFEAEKAGWLMDVGRLQLL